MTALEYRRRYRRVDFLRNMKIFLEEDTILEGITHDISTHSLSFFVSLQGSSKLFDHNLTDDGTKVSFHEIKDKLISQVVLLQIDGADMEPLDFKIMRIEPSWKKGYEVFIGGKFEKENDFLIKQLETLVPSLKSGENSNEVYRSDKLEEFRATLEKGCLSDYVYEFSNNYHNVELHRNLIGELARVHGFGVEEAYVIKLMADELIMNAFLYGSLEPGRDRTDIRLMLSEGQFYMRIRDYAGTFFDDYPYHFRKEKLEDRGGLSLVEEYSDDWQVVTEKGKFTDVELFKVSKVQVST